MDFLTLLSLSIGLLQGHNSSPPVLISLDFCKKRESGKFIQQA